MSSETLLEQELRHVHERIHQLRSDYRSQLKYLKDEMKRLNNMIEETLT